MTTDQKKIMVVEDEQSLREPLCLSLEKAGFLVSFAENGEAGLKEIKANKPDLLLLDIMMPVLDGIGMLKQMKQEVGLAAIPVIMLTNLSDTTQLQQAMQLGVKDYLVKSDWKLADVLEKVKEKLGI